MPRHPGKEDRLQKKYDLLGVRLAVSKTGTLNDAKDQDRGWNLEVAIPWRSFSDLTEAELRLTSVVAGTITILLFGAAAELFGFMPSPLAAAQQRSIRCNTSRGI